MQFLGGDLSAFIERQEKKRQPITHDLIIKWVSQLCLAIKLVHDRGFIHGDVKPANIFITSQGDIKLGDLGAVRFSNGLGTQNVVTNIGTPLYKAPEALYDNNRVTKKADIWGIGCVIFELL